MMRPLIIFIVILCHLSCNVAVVASPDTIFDTSSRNSAPVVAQQEKARELLRAWEFIAPDFIIQFDLGSESDLAAINIALRNVLRKQSDLTTAPAISDAARHYLVYAMARAQMVNSIDFSPGKLRHFFELNSTHYPCSPRASVSELLVPKTYTDAAGTTAILDEIQERLDKESFPRVAYHINDRLGKHGTGYLGEISADKVGPERFSLYKQVYEHGENIGGSGNPVGGPFETPAGWLFIQVHSFVGDKTDCFDAIKDRVAQDYGREWLKKIEADTLTTAAQELKPEVLAFTTGTALESRAFVVGGHALTFHDARAALPFLMGDARDPRFWQSIQRQALELELIYHSSVGKAVRELPEYAAMEGSLRLLAAKRKELAALRDEVVTTATLRDWYAKNHARYETYGKLSFERYECQVDKSTAGVSPSNQAQCTAALESLKSPTRENNVNGGVADRWSTSSVTQVEGVPVKRDLVTSATFANLSREQQVAVQGLEAGEWSAVFTENGQQKVVRVDAIERKRPSFDGIAERVAGDYWLEYQMDFWRDVAGVSGGD